eukprot:TRINITY_DN1411_c0_g2_i1.p2 TRINITY_DN1411_c0_g2~~TRINITY_DN1411_c0_g2_i1.p2  ORF type:complete len:181 (+),score=23.43 TRINITY_DN1411_c0_g2_i1:70-612(+)
MGLIFTKLWSSLFGSTQYKVIIVGLNNAGKTTTLYKLLLNEVVVTAATIGSNYEEYKYRNISFNMWDLGGQEKSRQIWSTYFQNTHAIILVVDSTDRQRLPVIKSELHTMLNHENLLGAVLVVFANKQDKKGAMSSSEISDQFALHNIKSHNWHIQPCCALTGEGLYEGIEWLANTLTKS